MFCTQCGTKLDDDARFCTNCGVAIDGVGGAVAEDVGATGEAGVDELGAADPTAVLPDSFWADDDMPAEPTTQVFPVAETVVTPSAAFAPPASQTIPMPPVASAPAASPASFVASAPAAASGKKSPSRGAIVAIVAVVCVLAIGAGVGVGVLTHGTGGDPSDAGGAAVSQNAAGGSSAASSAAASSSAASSAGSASSAASSASSASSSQSAADDASIKSMLTSYYDQLSGFDGEVRACATEFNNTYASASMSARRASLATCKDLESRVNSRLEQVRALNVPQSSAYYAKFQDICTLYDDLSHRIGVIVEAWEICVRYDDPSAHQDEITAPIARDNDGQSNIYFRDYEQRYPNARP